MVATYLVFLIFFGVIAALHYDGLFKLYRSSGGSIHPVRNLNRVAGARDNGSLNFYPLQLPMSFDGFFDGCSCAV